MAQQIDTAFLTLLHCGAMMLLMNIAAIVTAALVSLSSLVLGEVVSLSGAQVRRSSLFGYEVGGRVLDREEAAQAVAALAPVQEPRPGLVRVAPAPAQSEQPTLARAIHAALQGAKTPGDGSYSFRHCPIGTTERLEVVCSPARRATREDTKAWLDRAREAIAAAGMIAAVDGGKIVVMWRFARGVAA